ncbi:bifunctional adenosylcobinamide kinase/adenosylcobinamide-phosphate guanylyltransferase [Plantactinospora soyae]|uniref:Adenosylcobinamide kinase n=1 Tax=Plantactinospora soyae TaxID=1544732 RepID=A0A927MF57_9ACTN|nr:bifunctional adenosylcobinamide kinase/adenosylcobinamide-phosphate guanylyltransferase [Plantactinospora soyae]MBE1492530.1 nicotinate-nucleotide--dimethylbenzimidazole phosphoribosyltransferase [Plantactinospora soyae]
MSVDGWNRILVLGGIRSGKSEFAESLVRDLPAVRYVATAIIGAEDPDWAARIEAHQIRRPAAWSTEEANVDPSQLAELIGEAKPGETLLIDDLGGWVTVLLDPAHQPADDLATIGELGTAIRNCPARLLLVSPEVGLSMVPMTPLGRAYADALGATNQAVADACDEVVLVVAGQPAWLKAGGTTDSPAPAATVPADAGTARPNVPAQAARSPHGDADPSAGTAQPSAATPSAGPAEPSAATPSAWTDVVGAMPEVLRPGTAPAPTAEFQPPSGAGWATPTMALPIVATGLVIQPGMDLPMPHEYTGPAAVDRLGTLDLPGAGLGSLDRVVSFAAATQGTETPAPWRSVRVLLLHGDHVGGAAAGTVAGESARRADQARRGEGPIARLAAEVGATLQVVEAPTAAPMEDGPALSVDDVETALRYGWRLAEEAVEAGAQLIVLAACGAGTDAAAAAVLAATAGAEPAAVLGRVVNPGGQVDDAAWMTRCAAVRDAMHRTRRSTRDAKDVLAEIGGGDIAIATGVLLGATARRTPVLLDGPVGVAAGLVSRDLAGQARHWCLLPDHGEHPAVRLGADVLDLTPLLDLRLGLGEGAAALAALPLLRSALTLAAVLPVHPSLAAAEPGLANAGPVDGASADTGPGDTGPADTGPGDTGPGDTGPTATGPDPSGERNPTPAAPVPDPAEPWAPEPGLPGMDDDQEFIEPPPAGPGPTSVPDDEPPTGRGDRLSSGATVPPGA